VKLIKMLGLAMVAALAAMALLGAANASATQLCKVKESPCSAPNEYGNGTVIKTELNGVEAELVGNFPVKCQNSTSEGETTGNVNGQVIGKLTKVSFTNCHLFGGTCTVTSEGAGFNQPPYLAHVNQGGVVGNGTLWIGPGLVSHEQPGAKIVCGTTECVFKAKEKQGTTGEEAEEKWVKFEVTGGAPATATTTAKLKKTVGGNVACGTEAEWKATYKVTAPNPLWVI
jgi:hypothetical protein